MTEPAANAAVAAKLREMADVLEQQQADSFRVSAYRRAAHSIETLSFPVDDVIRKRGLAAVTELPGIGRGIGSAIVEMVSTGHWAQLDRLLGTLDPEKLFQTVPGIGPDLATAIHDTLHVDTLEALEVAAHDGRLEKVSGIGARRAAGIRAALADRLSHRHIRAAGHSPPPDVALLLDIDAEYRRRAANDELPRIAPKRFNPRGVAWLPVMHVRRGECDMTALFSNTERANELGRTRDWVVIYFHSGSDPEGQCTVVTETRGPLMGQRVVRGREGDCLAYYAEKAAG